LGALLSVKGPWPISADPAEAKRLVTEAWKRGVIPTTASALPNVIKIKPPLVIDEGEVETVLGVLADCLKVVFP
jgi:4-aminobutyrate aminotransferase-like enzyme